MTPLMVACENVNYNIVEELLSRGADPRAQNENGTTALLYAAKSRNLGIVKLICEKGVDVNQKDMWGGSALMTACMSRNLEMIKFLLFRGADPRKCDIVGPTEDFIKMKDPEIYAVIKGVRYEPVRESQQTNWLD